MLDFPNPVAPLVTAHWALPFGALLNALLVGALAYAVWSDLRTRRISNRLTYPLMLAGLAINGVAAGRAGLTDATAGMVLGGLVLLIPCALGAMGGGDVKLMAAIGALKGPFFAVNTLVFAGLAGGVVAMVYLLKEAQLASRRGQKFSLRSASIPYAPAIAAGALYALFSYVLG